ncbi:hypothetical protein [Paucilactobacillus sp. N302-9]
MDSSAITSVIAVAAIVSPLLTTLINIWYKNKSDQRIIDEKKVERAQQVFTENTIRIRSIFEDYCRVTSDLLNTSDEQLMQDQARCYGLVQLYSSSSVYEDLKKIQALINEKNINIARINFDDALADISAEIDSLPKQPKQ